MHEILAKISKFSIR